MIVYYLFWTAVSLMLMTCALFKATLILLLKCPPGMNKVFLRLNCNSIYELRCSKHLWIEQINAMIKLLSKSKTFHFDNILKIMRQLGMLVGHKVTVRVCLYPAAMRIACGWGTCLFLKPHAKLLTGSESCQDESPEDTTQSRKFVTIQTSQYYKHVSLGVCFHRYHI